MEAITTQNLLDREARRKIGDKARAIYEPVRKQLEKKHWGEYITINYDNGDYAVAPEHMKAVGKMRKKYPGRMFFTFRIGYRAVFHFRGLGATDGKKPEGQQS